MEFTKCFVVYVLKSYTCMLIVTISFPDDHSRVILKVSDEKGSDYINASYIEVGTIMHSMVFTYTLNRTTCVLVYIVSC